MNAVEIKPTLSIIGAGKVGCTLARLLYAAGYRIGAVYSRNKEHSQELAGLVGSIAVTTAGEAVQNADLVLLTISDDAISIVARAIQSEIWTNKAIIHTSGAQDREVLAVLAARGAMTGSLHPAFPFADVETSVVRLSRATFAVEATDEQLRGWLYQMVVALQGRVLAIPPGQKALYHAALVIASNYAVTLYAVAEYLLMSMGADRVTADQALNGLLMGTAINLQTQGIPDALTGPLVRADIGTIQAHLDALRTVDHSLVEMYLQLARLSLPLLTARGINTEAIERLLEQDNQHEVDHS